MMELLLVRHGESTWNAAGRMQGQTASPELTERGRRQAVQTGAQLLARGAERLLTSDLVRARQTAAIIGTTLRLEPETGALLRERHYGTWQGSDSAEAIRATRSLPDHVRVPGGESLLEVRQRWATLLAALRGVRGPVVVVTHGNLIVEAAGGPLPRNGSVTRLMLNEWTGPLTPADWSSPFPGSAFTGTG
jgi:broad specificity phosphatase PhoE